MKKGFNMEYIKYKIEYLENLAKKEKDEEKKFEIESLIDNYKNMYLVLLFRKGKVFYKEVSTSEFLSEFNGETSPYNYGKKINDIINFIAKKFLLFEDLPKNLNINDEIKYAESADLVYEFLKSAFSLDDANLFKDYFIKNKSFVLLDKNRTNAFVSIGDNELFIALPKHNNIKLAANMAHEAGHVNRILVNETMEPFTLLGEFESFTYEVRFMLWLIENDIHARDAINYLLNQMNFLEICAITRYYNNKYKLCNIKNPKMFERFIDEHHLLDRDSINKYQDVMDVIYTLFNTDFSMYLISYIAVINELDNKYFYDAYKNIIKNVGNVDSIDLAKSNHFKSFRNLDKYYSLRKSLISKSEK